MAEALVDDIDKERLMLLADVLQPARKTAIVDVGAKRGGQSPHSRLLDEGLCTVVGFDPQPSAYEVLEKDTRPGERFLPYAIGDGTDAELRVCRADGLTSLLEPNQDLYATVGRFDKGGTVLNRIALETHRLDDLAAEVGPMDMLKIDAQGSELSVFSSGREMLRNTVVVITEVAFLPLYKDHPMFDQQFAELRSQGFELHKFIKLDAHGFITPATRGLRLRRHRNQLFDGDAAFIRFPDKAAELGSEALKHFALLADTALQSFDIAVVCLERLVDLGAITSRDLQRYIGFVPHRIPT
ncbi:MAG: FkbM family methyltransferase [Pseudomonadota bacterium]